MMWVTTTLTSTERNGKKPKPSQPNNLSSAYTKHLGTSVPKED